MRKRRLFNLLSIIMLLAIVMASNVFSTPRNIMQATTDNWSTDWRPFGAYVENLRFVVFTEGEIPLAMLALQNGDIDCYDDRVPPENVSDLESNPNINVTYTPSLRFRALTLNCEKFPLNITAFRRAMAFGFDKYRANEEILAGNGQLQDSYIPSCAEEWEVESLLENHFYEADYVSGNASLENAGFTDLDGDGWREYDADRSGTWTPSDIDDNDPALVMEMYATAGYDPAIIACEILRDGLAAMGVRSTFVEMEFSEILDRLLVGDAWVACWTEGRSIINTPRDLYDSFRTGGIWNQDPFNYYHFSNDTIDVMLDSMFDSSSPEEIKQYARNAGLLLAFEQPQIVVYNDVNIGAYRTDRFDGWFEFAGVGTAGSYQQTNPYCATKVHLKESLGGPYGGILWHCLSDRMNTWNPYLQNTRYEATVFQYIYESLWNVDPYTWDLIPGLAYDWDSEQTVAGGDLQDGQKYTFYLYENVFWHDGEMLTAEDVNHSIYMWRDSPYHNPEMWDIYRVEMPDGPDGHTIELYVNNKNYFEFADTTNFYITPEHIWNTVENVTAYNPWPGDETIVGTGPYKVRPNGWVPGEYIDMIRNEDWRWDIRDCTGSSVETSTFSETTAGLETTETPCEINPPIVIISGIEDDGSYSGRITIEVSAIDESDIIRTEITIKDGEIDKTEEIDLDLTAGTWIGEYELDTREFPDDTYRIIIKVYDACNNVRTIRLDITFHNGITEVNTETSIEFTGEIPAISPGFEHITIILGLGMMTLVLWRRRKYIY
ncbi:MAG: hypothetical protein JSW11_05645 [Candidatus Heimdallarchaeota archaeon]|nr:MAG: hypothetical protein JSW11_05645 [Candidatus Heimdallarchaeota archaeon]